MGSFLVSCCVTNQSISTNEPVYVIPIFENNRVLLDEHENKLQYKPRIIYSTDIYGLVGVIFIGFYADYGRFQINWDKEENKYMFRKYVKYLFLYAFSIQKGENPYHDPDFLADKLVLPKDADEDDYQKLWDYIHEAIWEQRAFVNRPDYVGGKQQSRLEYFVAHKDYTDILIDMYRDQDFKVSIWDKDCHKFFTSSHEEKAKLLYDQYASRFLNKNPTQEESTAWLVEDMRSTSDYHFLGQRTSNEVKMLWRPDTQVRKELVEEYLHDFDKFVEVYKSFATLLEMYYAFTYTNVIIRPVYYASQDYGNTFGYRFAYFMNEVRKQIIQDKIDSDSDYYEPPKDFVGDREDFIENKLDAEAKSFVY